ncbi:hypothetical protein U1Q18_033249, partial [Sarracenia purpurea var. burkii]
RGFPPPTGSKRKVLGLSSSTKSGDGRLANPRPKDLGGLFKKSQKIREETSGEKSAHRERNCLIRNNDVFGSVLRRFVDEFLGKSEVFFGEADNTEQRYCRGNFGGSHSYSVARTMKIGAGEKPGEGFGSSDDDDLRGGKRQRARSLPAVSGEEEAAASRYFLWKLQAIFFWKILLDFWEKNPAISAATKGKFGAWISCFGPAEKTSNRVVIRCDAAIKGLETKQWQFP